MVKKRFSELKPIVLLDRDGTLIEEREYLFEPKQVQLLPGVVSALRRLAKAGFPIVVVSNQSGVGRGIFTLRQMHGVNRHFVRLLKRQKSPIDGLYCCPHHPKDRCPCRKPKLGMVRQAAKALRRSWKGSISVGDRPSDVELGQKTGGAGILVLTGYGRQWAGKRQPVKPDYVATNLRSAVRWIIGHQKRKPS